MKKIIVLMLSVFACAVAHAEVPKVMNLQSLVYDADGNLTTSDNVDLTINILDENQNVLYTEVQSAVPVVEGAVNISVGEPSGGIPLDLLDPSKGMRLLEVRVGNEDPFQLMPLSSVPYALWAEKAITVSDESITTVQIKNGTITLEDLADEIKFSDIDGIATEGQLPSTIATKEQLNEHQNSLSAHPASAVIVSGNFTNFVAANAQEALEKLDGKLAEETVNRKSVLTEEVAIRQAADQTLTTNLATETTNRTSADSALSQSLASESASRVSADTTLQNNIANESTARTSADGSLQSNIDAETSARSSADSTLQSNIDSGLATKLSLSGGTMTGDIAMEEGKTIDGVDVSVLLEKVNKAVSPDPNEVKVITDSGTTLVWPSTVDVNVAISDGAARWLRASLICLDENFQGVESIFLNGAAFRKGGVVSVKPGSEDKVSLAGNFCGAEWKVIGTDVALRITPFPNGTTHWKVKIEYQEVN